MQITSDIEWITRVHIPSGPGAFMSPKLFMAYLTFCGVLIGVTQWCCWSRCDLLWEKQGPARIGGDKGVADVKVNGLEFVTRKTEKTGNSNDVAL